MRGAICQECGEPADRTGEFCPNCGAFLEWSAVEGGEEAQPVAVVPVTDRPPPRPVAGGGGAAPLPPPPVPTPQPTRTGAPRGADTGRLPGPVAAPAAPAAQRCARCGTDNPPELRFCRKCALEFHPPAPARAQSRTRRRPSSWWHRLFGRGRTPAERTALRAYHRSLPMRYRIFRWAAAVIAVGLVAAATVAIKGDPLGWARARYYDLRDTTEAVQVKAELDPPDAQREPNAPPEAATDGDAATAWATTWTGGRSTSSCSGQHGTGAALVLRFRDVADVRKLKVLAGLPAGAPDRQAFNRPRHLALRSSDGRCRAVRLDDRASVQVIPLKPPVSTDVLQIDVLDVYPGTNGLVALAEVVPLQRPPH